MVKRGKECFHVHLGKAEMLGQGEKRVYMTFASVAWYRESAHRGIRKGGDFKSYFLSKKLYHLEMCA